MAIALFTLGGLPALLLSLNRWLVDTPLSRHARVQQPPAGSVPPGAGVTRRSLNSSTRRRPSRPLRVVRWVDASHAPASAGRMFMSGRMADVCAELDRLAALETSAG